FDFVRLAETLAAYVMLYEHIGTSRLLPVTPSDLATRFLGIINCKKAWRDIAGRKNIGRAFKEFNFPAPPEHPPPERPKITVKAGPVDNGPGGAGPIADPSGGDDDEVNLFDGWPVRRSGHISIQYVPRRGPLALTDGPLALTYRSNRRHNIG
ncbi:MAG: hypothetical protein ACKPKO_02740, partial [Candidatus Fonsibacter sp.]